MLLTAGIDGPYGLALGPDPYTRVLETGEHGGYPLLDHLRKILGGPLVWSPGVSGAVVVSMRGGDFLFESGEDLSIGYAGHDADAVSLYLEESFSFRVVTPEAAVALSAGNIVPQMEDTASWRRSQGRTDALWPGQADADDRPRPGRAAPPLWIESVESALLGRAQTERSDDGLLLTMFGRSEVVYDRITRILTSALGDGWAPLLEVNVGGAALVSPTARTAVTDSAR